MRILYLAHRVPCPPNKGDKIRTHHFLRRLAAEHAVVCGCFIDDPADQRHIATLEGICESVVAVPLVRARACWNAARAFASGEPASIGYYEDARMATALRGQGRFDAVIAFSASMAPHAIESQADLQIVDLCDLDSRKWASYADSCGFFKRTFYRTEAQRLGEFERHLYERFDATILISEAEASDWSGDRAKLHIIGNGVTIPAKAEPPPRTMRVGFTGDMGYFPNDDGVAWFLEAVWPQVRQAMPEAVFEVAGRNPSSRLQRLHGVAGVSVRGEVPNMGNFIAGCDVLVAPLRLARGVQNKVLEAMAAARPVVATPAAAAGIEADPGVHLRASVDAGAFAEDVIALLRNPDAAARLGSSARAHVEQTYTWAKRLAPLDALLELAPTRQQHRRRRAFVGALT